MKQTLGGTVPPIHELIAAQNQKLLLSSQSAQPIIKFPDLTTHACVNNQSFPKS
jgi:hypothetical protein